MSMSEKEDNVLSLEAKLLDKKLDDQYMERVGSHEELDEIAQIGQAAMEGVLRLRQFIMTGGGMDSAKAMLAAIGQVATAGDFLDDFNAPEA